MILHIQMGVQPLLCFRWLVFELLDSHKSRTKRQVNACLLCLHCRYRQCVAKVGKIIWTEMNFGKKLKKAPTLKWWGFLHFNPKFLEIYAAFPAYTPICRTRFHDTSSNCMACQWICTHESIFHWPIQTNAMAFCTPLICGRNNRCQTMRSKSYAS